MYTLCLNVFDDPRNLPCGLTFCLKCIQKLVDNNKDKQPSCALCRKLWTVPAEGLQSLMRNFVLNNFVQSFGQQRDSVIKCALLSDGDLLMEMNMAKPSISVLIVGILFRQIADRNEDAYIYCCNINGDKLSTFKVQQFLKSAMW